ncbi:MAG: hypothetical protein IKM30_06030 [Oscillospiraceae bacterium]|nr:hypothetical protein [Oscillospiraceae bacterium]
MKFHLKYHQKAIFLRTVCALFSVIWMLLAIPFTTSAAAEDGVWEKIGSRYYYTLSDGTMATGPLQIDGVWYLFAPNGAQQIGWQTVNGKRYYYHPASGKPVFGWLTWRDASYYITQENGKTIGSFETNRGLCYFDCYGVLQHGWILDADGNRCYADEYGVLQTGAVNIDRNWYLFDANGIQLTGWQTIFGRNYYYDIHTGEPALGWVLLDGHRYYIDAQNGKKTGEVIINGARYVFDEDGHQQFGWHTFSDGCIAWYSDEGIVANGFTSIGDHLYYFSNEGILQTGFQTIADAVYYFSEQGIMQTGLITIDGIQYGFSADGTLGNGWLHWNDSLYYCAKDGSIVTGWQTIENATYYFSPEGILQTDLQVIDGNTYYFAADGKMQTGVHTVDGVLLAFDADGKRRGGGWFSWNSNRYYCSNTGSPITGWQILDSNYYYFHSNGAMAVSTTVNGYYLDENGIAANAIKHQIKELLTVSGTTPELIYSYVTANYRYRHIEETRTLEQLNAAGWDTLVAYTLTNRRGVCYYLAATMDYFLQIAGYQTRLVYATHNTGDHYWCQVWYQNAWHNFDPTYNNRSDISWQDILTLGNYTVNGYVSLQYDCRGDFIHAMITAP